VAPRACRITTTPEERYMQDFDPQKITDLSTGTVVFLMVCVPGIILLLLLWASYNFAPLI
jgi:hypothetical protein